MANGAGGRPSTMPQFRDTILSALTEGETIACACALAGCSDKAFYDWQQKGRKHLEEGIESDYSEFAENIKKASSAAESRMVQVVRKAAIEDGQWQAACWWLERRRVANYGKNGERSKFILESTTPTERIEETLKLFRDGKISGDEATKVVTMLTSQNSLEFQNMVTNELQSIKDELNRFKAPKPEEDKDD